MVDLALQHSVNAQWRGITEIAEQLRAFTQVRRTKARTPAERITDIAQGIDRVDQLLTRGGESCRTQHYGGLDFCSCSSWYRQYRSHACRAA